MQVRHRSWLILLILVLLAGGCKERTDNTSNPSTQTPQPTEQAVMPALPSATPLPTRTALPPSQTPVTEPGPYFTPQRQPPPDSATFTPPEQLEGFTRIQLTGNCRNASGLLAVYRNSE